MVVFLSIDNDMDDIESEYCLFGFGACEDVNLLMLVPRIIFSIGYVVLVGNFLIARIRRIQIIKWLMYVMLASQAHEIWFYIDLIVDKIISAYFGESRNLVKGVLLLLLSLAPGVLMYINTKRRREIHLSWRAQGPRTELGTMRYYLTRPPPMYVDHPRPPLRRTKSQDEMATRRITELFTYPKSA